MNTKTPALLGLYFVIGLCLSSQLDAVEISVLPSENIIQNRGSTFNVTIQVRDVDDLGGYQFELKYNPDTIYIKKANDASMGSFLRQTGRNVNPLGPIIDNSAGVIKFGAFSFGQSGGASGEGTLADLTWTVKNSASGTLSLENVMLTDTNAETIPADRITDARLLTQAEPDAPAAPSEPASGGAGDTSSGCFIDASRGPSTTAGEGSLFRILLTTFLTVSGISTMWLAFPSNGGRK